MQFQIPILCFRVYKCIETNGHKFLGTRVNLSFPQIRDLSQTRAEGGPDAKRGALKIFDPCKGGPEKKLP